MTPAVMSTALAMSCNVHSIKQRIKPGLMLLFKKMGAVIGLF